MNIVKNQITINNRPLIFFHPENDSVIPGTLVGLQRGTWHFQEINFQDNDIFVDLGCSVGLISMTIAALYPNVKIYGFDANPVAIECFKMGVNHNTMLNVYPLNFAIGIEDKKNVTFITYNENESCLIEKELSANERNFSYNCNMISIDKIFDEYLENQKVKFMKVDIETGEFKLFDYLFENRMDILDRIEYLHLEIHPFDQTVPASKRLKEMVESKFKNKAFFY